MTSSLVKNRPTRETLRSIALLSQCCVKWQALRLQPSVCYDLLKSYRVRQRPTARASARCPCRRGTRTLHQTRDLVCQPLDGRSCKSVISSRQSIMRSRTLSCSIISGLNKPPLPRYARISFNTASVVSDSTSRPLIHHTSLRTRC